jgi:hypothetical protein
MNEFLRGFPTVLIPLLISAAYCMGLLSLGLCGLRAVGLSRARWHDSPLSFFLGTGFALGSGLAATLWLVLGLIGQFRSEVVVGVLVAATLLSLIVNRDIAREMVVETRRLGRALRREPVSWQLLALAVLLVVGIHAVSTLHPAVGDSAAFYLPWARVIADTGRVIALPGYEAFSDIWTIAEIQIAAIMMFAGDFAARPLPFWHAVAAGFLLWGAARAADLRLRGCILIVALLFTTSAVTLIVWDGKTDLVALPLGVAALMIAALKSDVLGRRQSIVIGLLAGAAVAAKLSYIPILGAGFLALSGWRVWQKADDSRGWKVGLQAEVASLAIIAVAGAAILAPQIIRNWIMTGEPLAPVYYFRGVSFGLDQDWFNAATTRRILLSYPIALTFGNYWGQHGTLSVLPLMFFPLCLVFARSLSRTFWLLAGIAFAGVAAWAILRTSTFAPRYILCSLALLYIFPAAIAARASYSGGAVLQVAIVAVTGYALLASFIGLIPYAKQAVSYARGGETDNYAGDEAFVVGRLLNTVTPPGIRVALMNHYRFPMRADLLECVIGASDAVPGAADSLQNYYVKGARYFVADAATHKPMIDKLMANVPSWLNLKQIYNGKRLSVYELNAGPGAPAVEFQCKRDGRLWQRATAK